MTQAYPGGELELFAQATNWKSYFAGILRPFIGGRVLEVGAGIGANIPFLHNQRVICWISMEPDPSLAARIEEGVATGRLPPNCHVVSGTIADLEAGKTFDTILYLDVLEHIADDEAELARVAQNLAPGGRLIVLAPAHQFLFSPFDESIGHHRRYSAGGLVRLEPPGCSLITCRMLDSAGFFASLGNRLLLSKSMPSQGQIAFWDKFLVPVSRRLDAALAYRFGKTVVAVWQTPRHPAIC
jgi:SAM-dependent methyltransferase